MNFSQLMEAEKLISDRTIVQLKKEVMDGTSYIKISLANSETGYMHEMRFYSEVQEWEMEGGGSCKLPEKYSLIDMEASKEHLWHTPEFSEFVDKKWIAKRAKINWLKKMLKNGDKQRESSPIIPLLLTHETAKGNGNKINMLTTVLMAILIPFKRLPIGYYRLLIVGWIIAPVLMGIWGYNHSYYYHFSDQVIQGLLYYYLPAALVYYILSRLALWIFDGFKSMEK